MQDTLIAAVKRDDLLIRREQEMEFMKLPEQLPSPQRSVLLLHFVEDFSLEEIGRSRKRKSAP